jgi:hypothetical protein
MNSPMRSRDWFTVGFRLLGVWMLVAAVGELVYCADLQFKLSDPSRTSPSAYLLHAAVDFAVGVALLRLRISLFWPEPDPDARGFEVLLPPDSSETDEPGGQ